MYNYKIKYLTLPIENHFQKRSYEISRAKNTEELISLLNNMSVKYYIVEKDIRDLKKISSKMQNIINSVNKIFIEKHNDFYQIIIIEKNLEFNEGIFYKIINYETESQLSIENQNCEYIEFLNGIKSSKEYELRINEKIKNHLKDINDFLILNNNKLNYIFLCQIRVNKDFLKEVNISKK